LEPRAVPFPTDLCLAATVAADLGVPADASVERCVSSASRAIARLCGRAFERATVTEYPASYGRPFLLLERPPLVAIVSVTEAGELLDPARYTIAGDLADGGLVYRLEDAWPDTARVGGLVTTTVELRQGSPAALAVTYTGGYVTPGQVALDVTVGPVTRCPPASRKPPFSKPARSIAAGGGMPTYQPRASGIGP
jgi:hypothetical protein